jgi:hypothetical protein
MGLILQILSCKNKFLDSCVLAHPFYGPFFHYGDQFFTSSEVPSIIDYFIIFRDMLRFGVVKPIMYWWVLTANFPDQHHPRWLWKTLDDLRNYFIEEITRQLDLNECDIELLRPFATTDFPVRLGHSQPELIREWQWIKEAKVKMNETKAWQSNKLADLIEEYPGMLKRRLDPQNYPSYNSLALIKPLRVHANYALGHRRFQIRPWGQKRGCTWTFDHIEIVPFDRDLWIFLDIMESHPPENDIDDIEGWLRNMALNDPGGSSTMFQFIKDDKRRKGFHYPEDIATSIKVVMAGLMYIYTSSGLLTIPRINWSPLPESYNAYGKPIFSIKKGKHSSPELPWNVHRCPVRKILPYDEREYEWLEAFLKVVSWMKKNLWVENDLEAG